jgi:hypothetical protein
MQDSKASGNDSDFGFRVLLIERAVAEQGRRLDELIRALNVNEAHSDSLPEAIVLDADSVSPFAVGFHFREIDIKGRPYRWTGRGDFFELRVRFDRSFDWTFELDLMGNEHAAIAALRGFVDYAEVPVRVADGGSQVLGTIPAKPLSDLAVLTFYLPAHFVPSRLDPSSTDHRTLSVVFYGLKLVPVAESAARR